MITTVTHRRIPVFRDFFASRTVIHALRKQSEWERVNSLAFVVMPDHFHWLFELNDGVTLDKVVRSVKSHSAVRINRLLNRQGPVWQPGYQDRALRSRENLRKAARYVVGNPLRAGLVEDIGRYPHWDAVWV